MSLRQLGGITVVLPLMLVPAESAAQSAAPPTPARRIDAFPEPFSLIRGLRELPTGVLLITDWIEERLAVVDFANGTAVTIGRVGSGPREYRLPAQLLPFRGDSTLLVDVGNARLIIIGPDRAIHRTLPARAGQVPVTPRGADAAGAIYFAIPPWALGPNAPPGDSVDVARWEPATDRVRVLARMQGAERPSWQKEGRPRMTPGIPMVGFSPQDAWVVAGDGRIAIVRVGDYHVEWIEPEGRVRRGPSYAYPVPPVSDADKRAFVRAFDQSSPMSGRGPDGGMGHTPPEFQTEENVARSVRANEFAERHPFFRAGGAWLAPDGALWVERSVPAGTTPVLDVFDGDARLVRQVGLPEDRRLVGVGRAALYAVVTDADGLQILERYRIP